MSQLSHYKISLIGVFISSILFTALSVFAISPGQTLDPVGDTLCTGPTDVTCVITSAWQIDSLNNFVFNETDMVGIGTNTPTAELHLEGDFKQMTTFPSGAIGIYQTGDTSTYGLDEGFISLVLDNLLTPVSVGVTGLDMNAGDPIHRTYVTNGIYTSSISATSFNDGIKLNTSGGGNISLDARDGGNITVSSEGDISLGTLDDIFILPNGSLHTSSSEGWYGGVNNGSIDMGTYRSDFSHQPFDATPAIVWELKNNQNYAMGFAALDEGTKRYANIYYGELDANNIITDITRIEATDRGANTMFTYDMVNGFTNETLINVSGVYARTRDISGSHSFGMANNGDFFVSSLTGGATTLETDANGNIIRTPSDQKLKTNIKTMTGNLDRVLSLNPVEYNWKDTERFGDQRQIGFIAQELELVVPEVVRSGGEYKSVNYQILTALLAGAIQELDFKVSILEEQTIESGGFSLSSLVSTIKNILSDMGNNIKDIFAKRITVEELCIENVCFDKQEAEKLKELISAGVLEDQTPEEIIDDSEDEIIMDTIEEEEEIVETDNEEDQNQETEEESIVLDTENGDEIAE